MAKVSHDLRNILASAQLFADRMETSEDPAVRRLAPKLVRSISRAVTLCETTLAFGKAEEPPPMLNRVPLAEIVDDVLENERLAAGDADVALVARRAARASRCAPIPTSCTACSRTSSATPGRRSRRPARGGEVRVEAAETETAWTISVADTGPACRRRRRSTSSRPSPGGARKGGTGLGLAIAAELVRGHGGRLTLSRTGPTGTAFVIALPKGDGRCSARRRSDNAPLHRRGSPRISGPGPRW